MTQRTARKHQAIVNGTKLRRVVGSIDSLRDAIGTMSHQAKANPALPATELRGKLGQRLSDLYGDLIRLQTLAAGLESDEGAD